MLYASELHKARDVEQTCLVLKLPKITNSNGISLGFFLDALFTDTCTDKTRGILMCHIG